jgi:Pentapeptide repeats (8 copies)
MSDEQHPSQPQRPTSDDRDAWKAYWQTQGMPWRTEPEIDLGRQAYLTKRRDTIQPNIEQGSYPFKDVEPKFTRADVEWLLATHDNGRGPVVWDQEKDKPTEEQRVGLDLRGAVLRELDLSRLPLARLRGGPPVGEWLDAAEEQRAAAAAHLVGATLVRAQLAGADLGGAHLERATLVGAQLAGKRLTSDELVQLRTVEPDFVDSPDTLPPTDLRRAYFDTSATLDDVTLGDGDLGFVALADVRWGGANLAVVPWARIPGQPPRKRLSWVMLGDEREARETKKLGSDKRSPTRRLSEFEAAARADRQLATVLRDQGLNDDADRFAYQAQVLQRTVLRRQGRYGAAFGSWTLDRVAGHGFRPGRTLVAYLLTIAGFTLLYLLASQGVITFGLPRSQFTVLPWYEALILSVSSFHGRGFFQPAQSLGDPVAILAASEAVFGLFIEVSFIATFTQRFFAR